MAGFFKSLFGKSKKVADEPRNSHTKKASEVAVPDNRVETIRSDQMDSVPGNKRAAADTGPWFIGKTVAEIFEIRSVLGRGGMGIVYRAYDTATQREVAVKVPQDKKSGKFVDDPMAKEDFMREVEAWRGLIYPHIVHAFHVRDDQTTDCRPAVFMDYCDGGSLAERLRRGPPLSVPDALDIAIQVCWAMEFAHNFRFPDGRIGLIHRDLKPDNVLVTKDAKVLVSDFGLVKRLELEDLQVGEGELKAEDEELSATVTRGAAVGTPEYMPPEQWKGNACKQSDMYAFGIMLYELFCGRRPFLAEKDRRWELRKVHEFLPPPDPRSFNPQLPEVLAALMLRCLAKRPAERPQGFDQVADELETAYHEATGNVHQTRREKPGEIEVARAEKESHAWDLIRLGLGVKLRGDPRSAERQYQQALAIFEEFGDQAGMGSCYNSMGHLAGDRGNYDQARELFLKALSLAETLREPHGLCACYTNMGILAKRQGNFKEARGKYREALAIFQQINDEEGMARCFANIGSAALDADAYCEDNRPMADDEIGTHTQAVDEPAYEEAKEMLQQSLAIYEGLNHKPGIGASYLNLGLVAAKLHCSDEAMEMLRRCLAIKKELGDSAGIARCYTNMGLAAMNHDDDAQANQYYSQAKEMFVDLGDKAGERSCCAGLSFVAVKRGALEEAFQFAERDLALCLELNNKGLMAGAYRNLAGLAEVMHKDQEMRECAQTAVQLFEELGMPLASGLRQAAGLKVKVKGLGLSFETSCQRAPVFAPREMSSELPKLSRHKIGIDYQRGIDGPQTAARLLRETFQEFGVVVMDEPQGAEAFVWIQAGSSESRFGFVIFNPANHQQYICNECGPSELTATIMTAVCSYFSKADPTGMLSHSPNRISQLLMQLDMRQDEDLNEVEDELVSMGNPAVQEVLASVTDVNREIIRAAMAGRLGEAAFGMRAMARRINVLGRIASPAAIPALLDALADSAMVADNPSFPEAKSVLKAASDALARLGSAAAPHLHEHLDDRRAPVRIAVANVLKRLNV